MKKLQVLAACLTLLAAGAAQAALYSSLEVGPANYMTITTGTSTPTYGGGSFDPAKLDGVTLPYIYCVDIDLDHAIDVPGSYNATYNTAGTTAENSALNSLVATRIAWLLTEFATDIDVNEKALQASIWNQLNSSWSMLDSPEQNQDYLKFNEYTTAVSGINVADASLIDNFYWLSVTTKDTGAIRQGMVTVTPIPGTLMLLGSGLAGLVGIARFRRKRSAD
ncbi:MAG: PEP-CTERM sorting domain-containing protein [Deltaproteobacteria bacterium]|nr:PEP-CTERM sorting domain-containing protein [Deltaproteobacteria bacterium]